MSLELGFQYVTKHQGRYDDFHTHYELAAQEACGKGGDDYRRFCQDLPRYMSDDRILKTAAEHLRRYGGPAPGPDGIRLDDFSRIDLWTALRKLRDRFRANEYERGPLKRCRIPKRPGSSEKRTIWLANVLDRVVASASAQTLTPLLEPCADPLSFCWRRRGTQQALARAQGYLVTEGRSIWLIEDLRNAFDRVPRERLLQILRHYVPNDEFCRLVMNLAAAPTKHGILQGSSLSPLLLDVCLTHLLHRPWRREKQRPPLMRYVDDVLVPCRPDEDAGAYYHQLVGLFGAAGFEPKHGPEKAIVDLRYQSAVWLGYRLRWLRDTLQITPKLFNPHAPENDPDKHAFVVQKFLRLHDRADGWRYVNSLIRSMAAQLAPTLPFVNSRAVYEQIAAAARDAAFEEILSYGEVHEFWKSGYDRWLKRLEDDK
jgi:RNA-directed DNA polymerase